MWYDKELNGIIILLHLANVVDKQINILKTFLLEIVGIDFCFSSEHYIPLGYAKYIWIMKLYFTFLHILISLYGKIIKSEIESFLCSDKDRVPLQSTTLI